MRSLAFATVGLCALTVSCSNGTSTTSPTTATAATEIQWGATSAEFDASSLSARPEPTVLTGLDAPSRAQELVAATADELDDVGPGWVAAYTELRIPVIDSDGGSQFADDPMGPRWDLVWSLGSLSRGTATVPLSDLGSILGADPTTPIDPTVLLSDLRAAAASTDPLVQTFGLFIAGKVSSNGGADLLDTSTTVDQVMLDAATIQLITWVVARDAFLASLGGDELPAPPASGFASTPSRWQGEAATPCAEALGSADETSWINWLAGKLGGGVGVEGVRSTPGLVEALVSQVTQASQGIDAAKRAGAKAAKFVSRMNIIASVLSLAAAVNAVQLNVLMTPDPLIRQRESRDGHTATIAAALSFSSAALNSNNQALCALSIVANALGVGLAFPADGAALPNVEVIVTSGQNFGEKVYFGADANPKRVTDGAGTVAIEVQGKARRKSLPPSTPERRDEFGLNFATQVEELTGQSLMNVFIDGLSLGAGVPSGIVDIAKSYHFDLGVQWFRFTDYGGGYKVSVSSLWQFPDAGLELLAEFSDALLEADESGVFTGSALVEWTTGSIGGAGCSMVETGPNQSSAVLTGVIDADGVLTLTVEYDEAVLENETVCPPIAGQFEVTAIPGEVVVIVPSGGDWRDTADQLLSASGQTQTGVATVLVVASE